MTKKRGRPPLNRPRVDYGTPEQIKRRMSISPSDPTQASCPLDALRARKLISDEAHAAAVYFAGIRKRMFGKAIPPCMDLTAVSGGPQEYDDKDAAESEHEYKDACDAMRCQNRRALDEVENVVVYDRWPSWMAVGYSRSPDISQKYLTLGLAALLGWYKNKNRRAA